MFCFIILKLINYSTLSMTLGSVDVWYIYLVLHVFLMHSDGKINRNFS